MESGCCLGVPARENKTRTAPLSGKGIRPYFPASHQALKTRRNCTSVIDYVTSKKRCLFCFYGVGESVKHLHDLAARQRGGDHLPEYKSAAISGKWSGGKEKDVGAAAPPREGKRRRWDVRWSSESPKKKPRRKGGEERKQN